MFIYLVTAVARKRSRSFCQKCRWQVTAKHASTLRMWLCMKWHGAWLYGVHRTRREGSNVTRHQACQRCKYVHQFGGYLKTRYKKLVNESARERRIALYKNDQQQQQLVRLFVEASYKANSNINQIRMTITIKN